MYMHGHLSIQEIMNAATNNNIKKQLGSMKLHDCFIHNVMPVFIWRFKEIVKGGRNFKEIAGPQFTLIARSHQT